MAKVTYDSLFILIANDSLSRLKGPVSTSDLERGLQGAARMQTGTVEMNGSPSGRRATMGGAKTSGLGRETGPEGPDSYLEHTSVGRSGAAAAPDILSASVNGPRYS